MSFNLRFLTASWLYLLALSLATAGVVTGSVWLWAVGLAIPVGSAIGIVVNARANLGSLGRAARTAVVAISVTVLGAATLGVMISRGGAAQAVAFLLMFAVIPVCFMVSARFLYVILKVSAGTLYMRLTGRGDLLEAVMACVTGNWEQALRALDRFEESHPEDPAGPAQRALVYLATRRLDEAADAVARSLALRETAGAYFVRGQALLSAGAYEDALADFERALAMEPKHLFAWLMTAAVYVSQRRLQPAIEIIRRMDRRGAKWAVSPHLLGDAYRLLGRVDEARKAYRRAAKRTKALPAFSGLRACALAEVGELEKAQEAAQLTLSKDETNLPALYAQALVQHKRGDADGVEGTLERVLAVMPNMVVLALTDPEFTSLLAEERFRRLLARAMAERDQMAERLRRRLGFEGNGA